MIKPVGEKVRHDGNRIRRVPRYAAPREDMFHVLRHTCASVQLEACESAVSLSKWLGHSTPKVPEKSLRTWIAPRIPSNVQVKGTTRQDADMSVKYKETARGGLAVNIIECQGPGG